MSRHELWEAMLQRKLVMLRGFVGLIQSIEMEDGSGYCFNVTMSGTQSPGNKTVFVRSEPASFIPPDPEWLRRPEYRYEGMDTTEYRKLCKEIHRKYGKKLDMSYHESCELADGVYFGEESESNLFKNLDQAVNEEIENE